METWSIERNGTKASLQSGGQMLNPVDSCPPSVAYDMII